MGRMREKKKERVVGMRKVVRKRRMVGVERRMRGKKKKKKIDSEEKTKVDLLAYVRLL